MKLKPIQEFMRLAQSLDRRINKLSEDNMYMSLPTSVQHVTRMRNRRRLIQMVLDDYILFQWLFDEGVKDEDLMRE